MEAVFNCRSVQRSPMVSMADHRGSFWGGTSKSCSITPEQQGERLTWFVAPTSANENEKEKPRRPITCKGEDRRGSSRAHEAPPQMDCGIGRLGGSPPSDLDDVPVIVAPTRRPDRIAADGLRHCRHKQSERPVRRCLRSRVCRLAYKNAAAPSGTAAPPLVPKPFRRTIRSQCAQIAAPYRDCDPPCAA